MLSYPPAPWRLRGHALIVAVRPPDPNVAERPLQPLRPGPFSPGFLLLAWYGSGSSLRYDEAALLAPGSAAARLARPRLEGDLGALGIETPRRALALRVGDLDATVFAPRPV